MLNSSLLVKEKQYSHCSKISATEERDVSSQKSPDTIWGQPSLIQWVPGSFRGGKAAGAWSDHSPPSSVQIKNLWSCTSTPHIHLRGLYREEGRNLPCILYRNVSSGSSVQASLNILFLYYTLPLFFPTYTYQAVSLLFRLCVFVLFCFTGVLMLAL
jgi:hypothetical protein